MTKNNPTSDFISWNHILLHSHPNRFFVFKTNHNGLYRIFTANNGEILRNGGNSFITNNGTTYTTNSEGKLLIHKRSQPQHVKIYKNEDGRFIAKLSKEATEYILQKYGRKYEKNKSQSTTKNFSNNIKYFAIHTDSIDTHIGERSPMRHIVLIQNPGKNARISSTIFHPSTHHQTQNDMLMERQGIIKGCGRRCPTRNDYENIVVNSSRGVNVLPKNIVNNVARFRANTNSFRAQLKPGESIIFDHNIPHSTPFTKAPRNIKVFRYGNNIDKIIGNVRSIKNMQNIKKEPVP